MDAFWYHIPWRLEFTGNNFSSTVISAIPCLDTLSCLAKLWNFMPYPTPSPITVALVSSTSQIFANQKQKWFVQHMLHCREQFHTYSSLCCGRDPRWAPGQQWQRQRQQRPMLRPLSSSFLRQTEKSVRLLLLFAVEFFMMVIKSIKNGVAPAMRTTTREQPPLQRQPVAGS